MPTLTASTNIFLPIVTSSVSIKSFLICTAVSFLCGLIIAAAISYRSRITKSMIVTLILLPAIVQTVILMVNGNIGTGIAVAGAFSLVRFRSVPGKAREIAAIFLAMTAGLASAAGFVAIALLFTVIVSAAYLIIVHIPTKREREFDLRITIPESLNFHGAFDDIFKKYTDSFHLVSVKTSNMGSLYKIDYKLVISSPEKSQDMIDELRCRNGNLEISLSESAERAEEL